MAGHSHAANVAIRKGAQDKKRAKLFTKLTKEIMVAAKLGGVDPDSNPRLRLALKKARGQSLPKDTITRALKKASGDAGGDNYDEISMEGYGPGGVAVYCDVLTDNRNRAAGEIRYAFTKGGGNLGTFGCVAYMFNRKGVIATGHGMDEDTVMIAALESGADDVEGIGNDAFEIVTDPAVLEDVANALEAAGISVSSEAVLFVPDSRVSVTGDDAMMLLKMLDLLDDCDDVQTVYHNADIATEAIEAYSNS